MSENHDDETTLSFDEAVASVSMPDLIKWKASRFYDYENQIADYESLDRLSDSVNAARIALFKITETINKYERLETEAKTRYDREWRRVYVLSNEKTDTARKNRADLMCEQYEDDMITNGQVKSELLRLSNSIRLELQTLQSIGNNLRQQLKME